MKARRIGCGENGAASQPAGAQTAGTMVMRMADADVIPFQFTDLAETIHGYVAELKKLALTTRDKTKEQNTLISEGVYKALYDPKKQFVPPASQPLPPYFNFAPLDQASDDLTRAAEEYDKAVGAAGEGGIRLSGAARHQLGDTLCGLADRLVGGGGAARDRAAQRVGAAAQRGGRFGRLRPADLRGLRVAWAPDLAGQVPVDPDVLAALAPVRNTLDGLGGAVEDDCPDFSGACEAWRTLRAWMFACRMNDHIRNRRPSPGSRFLPADAIQERHDQADGLV